MAKFKPPAVEESISPNLIPMIDIMFLLLLFFMLGADMSQRELTDVVLPEADQVQEVNNERGAGEHYIVINIAPKADNVPEEARVGEAWRQESNWIYAIRGKQFSPDNPDAFLQELKELADLKREPTPVEGTKKYLSAVFVTIRADKSAPYGMIQKCMTFCSMADLYKIDVSAAQPPKK